MKRRRVTARGNDGPGLSLTPMVDVVFLLLVFFVLAINPRDILAHLDVSRPRTGGGPEIPMLRIEIGLQQYQLNGTPVSLDRMDRVLGRISALSPRQVVTITCDRGAAHSRLINVLDLCAKRQLTNIALFSR